MRPLQELEDLAPGTWYLNGIAALPGCRGKGHGGRLMTLAEDLARQAGCSAISLVVAGTNTGALRLYQRRGYRQAASRHIVTESWDHPEGDWQLMIKDLGR